MNTETCNEQSGKVAPVVDRNKCEGKEDCVRVCPYNVFEIQTLTPEDRKALSLLGKIKAYVHGNRQAFVVNPADCHACNLCTAECPENAISLAPLPT